MASLIEIIESRLYWISDKYPPKYKSNCSYICIDNVIAIQELVYEPFNEDFGPLNLGMTYKFVYQLDRLLKDPRYLSFSIYHYCSVDPAKQANAAYLICAFQIIILKRTASEAWTNFSSLSLSAFRDASFGPCFYNCNILHCLRGLERSLKLAWFQYKSFSVKEYEHNERVENGDMNWIIPGKFLAFSSPAEAGCENGYKPYAPEDYVEIFNKQNITAVVRLNNKTYDEKRFTERGIRHYDLFFPDGSCPSEEIVEAFLEIAKREKGVAVHCKAGLGRTGTLIGCYAVKNFKFPAEEFIAWCRICRPGSILGPQQQFLVEYETKLYGRKSVGDYTALDKFKAVYGDRGQAKRLILAKRSFQTPQDDRCNSKNNYRTPLVRARSIANSDCN